LAKEIHWSEWVNSHIQSEDLTEYNVSVEYTLVKERTQVCSDISFCCGEPLFEVTMATYQPG